MEHALAPQLYQEGGVPPQGNAQSEKKRCGICLEKENLISLPCHESHQYHQVCIEEWKKINPHCPTCRKPLSPWYEKYGLIIYYGSFFTLLTTITASKYFFSTQTLGQI
jgi:hypothetical protein